MYSLYDDLQRTKEQMLTMMQKDLCKELFSLDI